MELYRNGSIDEQKREVKHQFLDIFYDVIPDMIGEIVDEVLLEESHQIPDDFDLFDAIFEVDKEMNVTAMTRLADDTQEEEATPPPVPSSETPPGFPNHPEIEENDENDEEVHRQYVLSRRNTNTVKKTESVLRKVHRYFRQHMNEHRDILDIEPKKLASLMSLFVLGVKKDLGKGIDPNTLPADQVYHQPDTLTSYYTGVARYCRENDYPCYVMTDSRFDLFKKVLSTRQGEVKDMGLGNHPNQAVPLSDEDQERCCQSGAFGKGTPRDLRNTIYFYFSNAYGWRGRNEQADVRWGDLAFFNEGTDDKYLKWNERGSKTRKGKGPPRKFPTKLWAIEDTERCPIALFKILKTLRSPEQCERDVHLFLTPKYKATMDMKEAFKSQNMGEGTIGKIMPSVKQRAGLTGQVKGHSVRKTCATNLLQQGVPPNIICQLTGHANVNSLNNYAAASMAQQKEMSDILVGGKRPATDRLAPGTSILKWSRPQPSAAAGSAQDLAVDIPDAEVHVPNPVVLAPRPHQGAVQTQMGGMPVEVAGMFSGATIHGGVHINIHYGNVAATASTNTQVNVSPTIPRVNLE